MWWKFTKLWIIFILGLITALDGCESRAINISNTWTLPKKDFNVFYRFFRDKISWFEADAVCQFHHANLVTVDNSLQFDATRGFLQVLDVTEPVWIGLMRPQNSQLFTWSNSKPLASSSGYWAESLPLMDSPLCAVIDPVRDFRWHALRCGGPETASFLCEMSVPNWAKECIPMDMPSLTIQYMADSGTVELSKDCGDEGTVQRICRTRQDRDKVLKELVCKNEDKSNTEKNTLLSKDLSNTHFKSLEFIKNVPTDNNEDNNISTQQKKEDNNKKKETEKNPVQKLIEQFSVEELMQADQPQDQIKAESSKMPKKSSKKAKSFEKKADSAKKIKTLKEKSKEVSLDDMMMGDQPALETEELQEPLPHTKKSLTRDLKHNDGISTEPTPTSVGVEHKEEISTLTPSSSSSSSSSADKESIVSSTVTAHPAPETKTGSMGHPMHPQQPRGNAAGAALTEGEVKHVAIEEIKEIKETKETKETKESKEAGVGGGDSHFIPPMLLVKSHYTSTKSHLEEQGILISGDKIDLTTQHTNLNSGAINTVSTSLSDENGKITTTTVTPLHVTEISTPSFIDTSSRGPTTGEQIVSSTVQPSPSSNEHKIVEVKLNADDQLSFSITTRPAPVAMETARPTEHDLQSHPQSHHLGHPQMHQHQQIKQDTQIHKESTHQANELPTTIPTGTTNTGQHNGNPDEKFNSSKEHQNPQMKPKNKFSNEENFQPYKPNRRRALTKPETTTYLKKILG